jgi:hypothetical protein
MKATPKMKTSYRIEGKIELTLKAVTFAPYRKLTDAEIMKCRESCWKGIDPYSGTRTFLQDNAGGGEACLCFKMYCGDNASFLERVCHLLGKIKTAALDYVNVSTVKIKVVL